MHCITLALLLMLASPASAGTLTGRARVVDGDTIALAGERIRLDGIDAPEGRQQCLRYGKVWRCGGDATAALRRLVNARTVECEDRGRDRYRRVVAVCRVGSVDLGAEMVREGWALDYPHYSHGRYAGEQAEAKAGKRGIWAGEFIPPWEWRKAQRAR